MLLSEKNDNYKQYPTLFLSNIFKNKIKNLQKQNLYYNDKNSFSILCFFCFLSLQDNRI